MSLHRELDPKDLNDSVIRLIGTDWMLVTAGAADKWNTMTASWGGMGVLWNKNVAMCFIRPGRHTFPFMEQHDRFSLSFFDETWRKALQFCGSRSGRDVDKAKETGLVPVAGPNGTISFEQARLVLECRKLYWQDIDPDHFLDPTLMAHYPLKDYHRMYVSEILSCRVRD